MKITYNKAAIIDSADRVIQNAAQMVDDHADITQRTQVLLADFGGDNSFSYSDHQSEFLRALAHLIETTTNFGTTVHAVLESAIATDMLMAAKVPGV